MTIDELYTALTPDERALPVEALTHWECDSVPIESAAVVDDYLDIWGEIVRAKCVLLAVRAIPEHVTELDGSAILRVVIRGEA